VAVKETPFVVETDDATVRKLRELYDRTKADRNAAQEKLDVLEEQLRAIKTGIEAELYKRSNGAELVDLRIRGVAGALRMRHKPYTRVDRDALEAKYPEVYQQVLRVTYTWELREVK
jgi:hypothetical protein